MGLWLERQIVSLRQDLPKPVVVDGEALVRVIRAGICSTDVELSRGYYPYTGILGHEFVGVVEQGPDQLVGRRRHRDSDSLRGRAFAARQPLSLGSLRSPSR